jgi:hypothetical protein
VRVLWLKLSPDRSIEMIIRASLPGLIVTPVF